MKKFLFLWLAFVPGAFCAAPGIWKSSNPGGGGWFARVGVGPSGLLLAGSDLSGAYRSADQGATWDNLGAAQGQVDPQVEEDFSVSTARTDTWITASRF